MAKAKSTVRNSKIKTRKKVAQINRLPKYFTTDVQGKCVVYELSQQIDGMLHTECLYRAVKCITYDGGDAVVEDATGSNARSVFLEVRDGTLLPDVYDDCALSWFVKDDIKLDDVIVICSI